MKRLVFPAVLLMALSTACSGGPGASPTTAPTPSSSPAAAPPITDPAAKRMCDAASKAAEYQQQGETALANIAADRAVVAAARSTIPELKKVGNDTELGEGDTVLSALRGWCDRHQLTPRP